MNPPPVPTATNIEKVRSGQKLIIYAILFNIASLPLRFINESSLLALSGGLLLIAVVISIIGLIRLAGGLGYSIGLRILFGFLMLVPCVSLIVLLILNAKATTFLRAAGLRVGLLGASQRPS